MSPSFASVYNGLHFLLEAGLITAMGQGGASRYNSNVEQCDHLICAVCGAVHDVQVPDAGHAARSIGEEAGFSVLEYRVTITGVCPLCAEER